MAKIACPKCALPATVISIIGCHTTYCPKCGWNRKSARADLRISVKLNIAFAIMGVILAGYVFVKNNEGTGSMAWAVLVAFWGISILNLVPTLRHLRKLTSIPPAESDPP